MVLSEELKKLIISLQGEQKLYYGEFTGFTNSPRINLFRPVFNELYEFFREIEKLGLALINQLGVQDAYHHHGLTAEQLFLDKLKASIDKNTVQWTEALERARPETGLIIDQLIAYDKQLKLNNKKLQTLWNAKWRPGTELPADSASKMLWALETGPVMIMDYLDYGYYDTVKQTWMIHGEPVKSEIKIKEWADHTIQQENP